MPPDLADELLIPVPPEALTVPPPKQPDVRQRLPAPFVRIPTSWFTTDPRPSPFGQRERLFLLLLHLSRWGQRRVVLTTAVAEQIGLSRNARWRQLERLESDGWVRIERHGGKAVAVHPIVIAG